MSSEALDRDQIWDDFAEAVNVSPAELETWLQTDESKSVGWTDNGGGESVGHHSGAGSWRSSARRRTTSPTTTMSICERWLDMSIAIWRRVGRRRTERPPLGGIRW